MKGGRKGDGGQFFLQRSFGTILHKTAHGALAEGVTIGAYTLMRELDSTKFYDSRPPLPYIMAILWIQVFPNLVHDKKRKRLHANKKVVIKVGVGRIHRLASRLAPSSNPECVERSWIVASMEEFVRVGLAERTSKDEYRVSYAIRKSQPLKWLVRLTAARRQAAQKPPKGAGTAR